LDFNVSTPLKHQVRLRSSIIYKIEQTWTGTFFAERIHRIAQRTHLQRHAAAANAADELIAQLRQTLDAAVETATPLRSATWPTLTWWTDPVGARFGIRSAPISGDGQPTPRALNEHGNRRFPARRNLRPVAATEDEVRTILHDVVIPSCNNR
jgi:hypothetical protein